MKINAQTKIAALLKHHPEALEAIITISPDFKKLRNPILRKLMAGRTSILMASKIGKCTPNDFFKVLKPLGFEVDTELTPTTEEKLPEHMPIYLRQLTEDKIIDFDVREMLASGVDPLRAIQDKIKTLTPGYALKIINTFEPVPLILLLNKQGYASFVKQIAPDNIETYFYQEKAVEQTPTGEEISDTADWDVVLSKFQGNLVEIDVRHLEMPMPMMTILENLETLEADKALYVHHKKIPVFLLTELKDRSFEYRIKNRGEGEVFLLIFKA
jgi:uncharacterized protein (DUF2249 family)